MLYCTHGLPFVSLRAADCGVAAQPLAALPPYGCGVPPCGYSLSVAGMARVPNCGKVFFAERHRLPEEVGQ